MKAYPTFPNMPAMMFALARTWPGRPMFRVWRNGAWQSTRWGEFGRLCASVARRLRAVGIAPGDRVMIASENRPEYPIAETALMAIRAVPVPTYVTNTVDDHAHILRDSGARAAIVSSAGLAGRVRQAAAKAGGLDFLIVMDGPPEGAGGRPRLLPWAELVAEAHLSPDDIALEAARIPADTLACLIYTSGTGGAPKGVMLAHRSLLSNCVGGFNLLRPMRLGGNEVYLSFLPAAHSYEHLVGLFLMPSMGIEIVFSRGVEHLAADMLSVRPTLLTAVPRVLEAIRGRILGQVARQPEWRRHLFEKSLALGSRRLDGERLTPAEQVLQRVLDRVVCAKIRARFGGRIKGVMCGGARLEPDLGRFFLALGIRLMQGYGQSEAGPVISATSPDAIRIETVGKPLLGVDLRLAEDGEILVRGGLVMAGYWNRPEETASAITNGWLHTGDIGVLDDDGNLRITDRKKDLIVLSGGENVSPAKIEAMLAAEPEIAQAVVTGDGRAGVSALIVPADGHDEMGVAVALSRVNMRLSVTERIRKHALVPPFTVENGLLTPSQKVRRVLVMRNNSEVLARMHA